MYGASVHSHSLMKRRQKPLTGGPEIPAEKLDELNASTFARRDSSQKIRRAVESQIDAQSRRRREEDLAAARKWKKAA
jgi:hypothetical protein